MGLTQLFNYKKKIIIMHKFQGSYPMKNKNRKLHITHLC